MEKTTVIKKSKGGGNIYLQKYNTAGICEQNFCFCFTHTVDIITLFMAFIVGRTAHRKIFFWRLLISLAFDLCIPVLVVRFYDSL